jgi:preprotein translocase subunit SecG
MTTFLTIVHVFVCLFLVAVVLLQSGRAGGMGVLSGAQTQTVFGGRGAGGFLTKATAVCATLFMLTSASLAYTSSSGRDSLARTENTATDAGTAPHSTDAARDVAVEASAAATTASTEPSDATPAATGDASVDAPTDAPAPSSPSAP